MMPGPYPLPTEEDIKETFFGCQQPDDQSAFIRDAKKLASAATREELINFMEILSSLRRSTGNNGNNSTGNNSGNGRDYNRNKNGGRDRYDDRDSDNDREYDDEPSSDESCSSDNDDESSNESDDSRHDDRDSRNKRNGNRYRNGGDRNDDQARKRSRDKDKCPFHPEANHTWSDCFGNPNGRNWKPQFAARVADILAKAKSGSNNNNKGGDTNAHVHDD
jgi:hypothetical protein